jgi:hypothetical protein
VRYVLATNLSIRTVTITTGLVDAYSTPIRSA